MSLISVLPRELKKETMIYFLDFAVVLDKTGLFPIPPDVSKNSRRNLCLFAASNGHLSLLKWARQNKCPWGGKMTCVHAAKNGHLHILKWMKRNGGPMNIGISGEAAKYGHLDVLKWADRHGLLLWSPTICSLAAIGGHLHILEWTKGKRSSPFYHWDEWTCFCAAEGGHFDILRWLIENGCPCDEFLRSVARGKIVSSR